MTVLQNLHATTVSTLCPPLPVLTALVFLWTLAPSHALNLNQKRPRHPPAAAQAPVPPPPERWSPRPPPPPRPPPAAAQAPVPPPPERWSPSPPPPPPPP